MFTEDKKPKVSFIIPAYNAEAYIESTIRSILSQDYGNIELVVADDGSKDSTAEIISRISREDGRLRLLQCENGGPACARNLALDSLDGSSKYIMFCDADDLLNPGMVTALVKEAEESEADFVACGFSIVSPDGSLHDYFEPDQRLDSDSIGPLLGRLYKANLLNQVWGKLFRSEVIFMESIRFPDYRWGEDRFFVFDYLNHSRRFSILSFIGYRYIMRGEGSLISSFLKNKADICVLIDERMEELCRKFGVEDDGAFRYMFAKSIFSCMANLFSPSCSLSPKEKREYVKSIVRSKRVLSRCSGAKGSLPMTALCALMKTGNVTLNLFAARLSFLASRLFPEAFRKMKHKK